MSEIAKEVIIVPIEDELKKYKGGGMVSPPHENEYN